jgi:NAD(P)-dependent dehydrogenase (short-subunit alcohol dehydrogenase family)
MPAEQIALITGANKGIGFEVAKELAQRGVLVLVGARDETRGRAAVDSLLARGLPVAPLQLDVTDDDGIARAARAIDERYGRLDILINNAGISGGAAGSPSEITRARMRQVYETNVFGVVAVTNALLPLLRQSAAGRIVNLSSGLGSLTLSSDPGSEFGYYNVNVMAYQSSKAALNAITVAYAKELRPTGIKVNAADPGYTATDFTNHRGYRTVEQAASIVVRLATLAADGPTGTFHDENGRVPW